MGKAADYSREHVISMSRLDFAKKCALCLFNSLKDTGLINRTLIEKQVNVSMREDQSVRVFLDGSAEDSSLFAKCFDELLSPIIDQRYAIPRYEVAIPKGNSSRSAISAGLKSRSTFIAAYHPVPDALGANKDKAEIFRNYWNRLISRGEIVFLKSPEGEKIIEQFGMNNGLGIKKQVTNFWR